MVEQLAAAGLWDELCRWEPAPVDERWLELVHTREHIQRVREAGVFGGVTLLDVDTVVSPGSWEAALRAAGACVEAAQRVSAGRVRNAFCLVRPPGHHATSSAAMGFCLFNNIAVAAAWLLRERRAERIAILDYDAHHGNGTQEIFDANPAVLYVSTHEFPWYPGSGDWDEQGDGDGLGRTVNIPLPDGAGDEIFQAVRVELVEPLVRRFEPDFVLVSLGFDGFWGDPLAQLRLSLWGGFRPLLESARALAEELCGGRLVVTLEGGYHLEALAYGAELVCRVLAGQPVEPDPLGPAAYQLEVSAVKPLFHDVKRLHGL
jgi:acetoin utilization deacetylase AcuC-like enzyme